MAGATQRLFAKALDWKTLGQMDNSLSILDFLISYIDDARQ